MGMARRKTSKKVDVPTLVIQLIAADSGSLTAGPLTAVTLAPFARLPRHHPRARSPRRARTR